LAGNVVDRIFETIGGPLGGKNSNVVLFGIIDIATKSAPVKSVIP